MNTLIIEDDKFLRDNIARVFQKKTEAHMIRLFSQPEELFAVMGNIESYDMIITDLCFGTLSSFSGFDIIRTIRAKNKEIPIIVISALSDVSELERAFSLGASDYIIKPFRLKELEVRVINWYKNYYLREFHRREERYRYHDLEYDIESCEFFYKNTKMTLSKKSKYLLLLFFTHFEKLLTQEFLEEKLYADYENLERRNIRINIKRLKDALSRYGISHWIENIPGEWYLLCALSEKECTPPYRVPESRAHLRSFS